MTKGQLIQLWAGYPDDTVLALPGEYGQPVDIFDIEPGLFVSADGQRRQYLQFTTEEDDG